MADQLTRRRFLETGVALTTLPAIFAACGIEGTGPSEEEAAQAAQEVRHPKERIGNWTFSNWPLYMDKKVLRSFDKEYGGKVRYLEEINDNYEFFGKVGQQLEQKKPIGRDIVVLTDYMASRWVRNAYVEPIDKANVPNAANLVDNLATISYDPDRRFTLPFQSGAIGAGYDIKKTGRELTSVQDLFDPKFKGLVSMFSEPYDSACTVLLGEGVDASTAKIDQILTAIEKLDELNRTGQFRRFTGNEYTTDLAKGNVWVSLAYSGDVVSLQSDNPNLRFAYFEEGNMAFNDNLMMPAEVEHPYAAETMMNYLYDPEVAAKLAAYINYISPVKGAKEVLEKTDPELANNPLIFPAPEILAKLHAYPSLTPQDERTMQEAMASVTGA